MALVIGVSGRKSDRRRLSSLETYLTSWASASLHVEGLASDLDVGRHIGNCGKKNSTPYFVSMFHSGIFSSIEMKFE